MPGSGVVKNVRIRSAIMSKSVLEEYIDLDTAKELCLDCDNYNSNWSCPPFVLDLDEHYQYAVVIAGSMSISGLIDENEVSIDEAMTTIFFERREEFTQWLLEFETLFPGIRSVAAGVCKNCDVCARTNKMNCRHPNRVRPSLEALGFNIQELTKRELSLDTGWPAGGGLPEDMTAVGALLIRDKETLKQIAHIMRPLEV